MSCFIVGSMNGLTNKQLIEYGMASSIFKRVQAYNENIRTRRIAGNNTLSYYIFANNTEMTMYRQGQFLLTQNDPVGAAAGFYNDVVQI
jgi:hypothetical protein